MKAPMRKRHLLARGKPSQNGIAKYEDASSSNPIPNVKTNTVDSVIGQSSTNAEHFIERFSTATADVRQRLYHEAVDVENRHRELFAQDRNNPILNDPYLHLIPAHQHIAAFSALGDDAAEAKIAKVFPLAKEDRKQAGEPTIVGQQDFKRSFDIFSEGQLRNLDWNNVFCAGGSVLACLQPLPQNVGSRANKIREYHHTHYKSSDIDLFIYGLNEEEANAKLLQIFETIRDAVPHEVIAFRSKHAITLVSQFPYRHIQIVLRLYKSPAEVLMGFDVDSCSVGFDGKKVWMTPRCHRSLISQCNFVDMSRRSPSYEMRLAKYSDRGFSVAVPDLKRERIDPQIYEKKFDQLFGLARLLVLEKLQTPEARQQFRESQRARNLQATYERKGTFWRRLSRSLSDEYMRERIESEGGNASDYSCVFLPWGPGWTAQRVCGIMQTKDIILNSKWYDPKKQIHTHPCFFGTIEEVMKDCCGQCPPNPNPDPESMFVSGPLTWVTVDPGRQSIGSFHPITDGDWAEGAYISVLTERLCAAVNKNDKAAIQQLINDGVDLNCKDALGRTPIIIAALSNCVDACTLLLAAGADVKVRFSDGRTALHIAAANGFTEILHVLLTHIKSTTTTNESDPMQLDVTSSSNSKDVTTFSIDAEDWNLKMTPLQLAVFYGHTECVRLLIASGASLEKLVILKEEVRYQGDVYRAKTILHLAISADHRDIVLLLLDSGASINQLDYDLETPLFHAIHLNKPHFVRLLLDYQKNGQSVDLSIINSSSQNVLCVAIAKKRIEIAKMIIEHQKNNNNSATADSVFSVTNAQLERTNSLMQELESKRNNVGLAAYSACNAAPQPLAYAVSTFALDIVELLLKQPNVDPSPIDTNYQTPMDIFHALQAHYADMLENLLHENETRKQQLQQRNSGSTSSNNNNKYPIGSYERWITDAIDNTKGFLSEVNALYKFENQSTHNFGSVVAQSFSWNNFTDDDEGQEDPATAESTELKRMEIKQRVLEKILERIRTIIDMLASYGCKRFIDMVFDEANEPEMVQMQNTCKAEEQQRLQFVEQRKEMLRQTRLQQQTSSDINEGEPTFQMSNYSLIKNTTVSISWGSKFRQNTPIPKGQAANYHELFKAAFNGDIATIRKLTVEAANPVFICSCYWSLSSVDVAVLRGFVDCALEMLQIAIEQYAPESDSLLNEDEDTHVPTINNYVLMHSMHNPLAIDSNWAQREAIGDIRDAKEARKAKGINVNSLLEKQRTKDSTVATKCNANPLNLLFNVKLNLLQAILMSKREGFDDATKARYLERALELIKPLPSPSKDTQSRVKRRTDNSIEEDVVHSLLTHSAVISLIAASGLVQCLKAILPYGAGIISFADLSTLTAKEGHNKSWNLLQAHHVRQGISNAIIFNQPAILETLLSPETQATLKTYCNNVLMRHHQATAAPHTPASTSQSSGNKRKLQAIDHQNSETHNDSEDAMQTDSVSREKRSKTSYTSFSTDVPIVTAPFFTMHVDDDDKNNIDNTAHFVLTTCISTYSVEMLQRVLRDYVTGSPLAIECLLNNQYQPMLRYAMQMATDTSKEQTCLDMIRVLLEAGANPFVRELNTGFNALHSAVALRQIDALQLFVEYSTTHLEPKRSATDHSDATLINSLTADSKTPLMLALQRNFKPAVQYLLQHPMVDVSIRDSNGESALHYASKFGFAETIKLILEKHRVRSAAADSSPANTESFAGLTAIELAKLFYAQAIRDNNAQLVLYNYDIHKQEIDNENQARKEREKVVNAFAELGLSLPVDQLELYYSCFTAPSQHSTSTLSSLDIVSEVKEITSSIQKQQQKKQPRRARLYSMFDNTAAKASKKTMDASCFKSAIAVLRASAAGTIRTLVDSESIRSAIERAVENTNPRLK